MEIAVIGVSHKEAPVHIRGQVAFTTSSKEATTAQLKSSGIQEFMIISTCNRSEIYIASNNMARDIEVVKQHFTQMAGPLIMPYLFVKKYEVALQHIYQVASGMHSLIIGEDQILGQMKDALAYAIELKSAKKYLTKVVREAVTFSKKVRTTYKLSESQLSVAAIGIKYLKDHTNDIKNQKILVVGTGDMGLLVLRYLESEGVKNIYLTNRTYNKSEMPDEIGSSIQRVEYKERYKWVKEMDCVISATASPHTIFKKEEMPEIESQLMILDMAVPRDVDEAIDNQPNITVVTLDDFDQIAIKHQKQRQALSNQINRLILDEVKEVELWLLRSKVDVIIEHLHSEQMTIVDETMKQLADIVVLQDQHKAVEAIIRRSVGLMTKEPIKQLKQLEEVEEIDRYKMMLEKLFDLKAGEM